MGDFNDKINPQGYNLGGYPENTNPFFKFEEGGGGGGGGIPNVIIGDCEDEVTYDGTDTAQLGFQKEVFPDGTIKFSPSLYIDLKQPEQPVDSGIFERIEQAPLTELVVSIVNKVMEVHKTTYQSDDFPHVNFYSPVILYIGRYSSLNHMTVKEYKSVDGYSITNGTRIMDDTITEHKEGVYDYSRYSFKPLNGYATIKSYRRRRTGHDDEYSIDIDLHFEYCWNVSTPGASNTEEYSMKNYSVDIGMTTDLVSGEVQVANLHFNTVSGNTDYSFSCVCPFVLNYDNGSICMESVTDYMESTGSAAIQEFGGTKGVMYVLKEFEPLNVM